MPPSIVSALDKLRAGIRKEYPQECLHRDLSELLNLCAPSLAGASRADQVEILREIAFLLTDLPGNEPIWSWLRHLAKEADPHFKDTLTVTVFELVPEDPVDERDLMCLWSCIDDVRTRWVIAEAYARQPHKMLPHFVCYLSRCPR